MLRILLTLACVLGFVVTAVANGWYYPPSADSPVVYLPMDGDLNDASGNGHNATLYTGEWGTAAFVTAPSRNGRIGQALDLDVIHPAFRTAEFLSSQRTGGGAYVALPYTLTESGTISLWYKTVDFTYNYQQIFDNEGTDPLRPEDNWEMWIDAATNVGWRASKDSANGDEYTASNVKCTASLHANGIPYLDSWLHLTATWQRLTWTPDPADDGTEWEDATYMKLKFYVNGGLIDETPDLGGEVHPHVWQDPGAMVYLGGGCYNLEYNRGNTAGIGTFDELAIWDVMLTDAEVMDVYLGGSVAPSRPIPADANEDDISKEEWASILTEHWHQQSGATFDDGDFNGDGKVDDKDASILAAYWDQIDGCAPIVPEPSAFALLAGGLLSMVLLRRKR